jgi:hypothetical protein
MLRGVCMTNRLSSLLLNPLALGALALGVVLIALLDEASIGVIVVIAAVCALTMGAVMWMMTGGHRR